jgi:hypothetical protein
MVDRLEAGDNHADFTVGRLVALAETLAVDPADLLAAPSAAPDGEDGEADTDGTDGVVDGTAGDADGAVVARLVGLLRAADVTVTEEALAEVLDVDLVEVGRLLDEADVRLAAVGLRTVRQSDGVGLVAHVDAVDEPALELLLRQRPSPGWKARCGTDARPDRPR